MWKKNETVIEKCSICSAKSLLMIFNTLYLTTLISSVSLSMTLATTTSYSYSYKNVFGNTLQSCSSDGMALTGYTRSGYCVDRNDDAGSHHICIDLSSTSFDGNNFCQVTGQSNWCDSSMPCHDDQSASCSVQNWCVCQWAFASYIDNAGGCDQIQEIVCDAINEQAILAYRKQVNNNPKYYEALACLVNRCNLSQSFLTDSYTPFRAARWKKILFGASVIALVAIAVSMLLPFRSPVGLKQRLC
jgi:uncharacterized protein (DUF2237 family)